MKKKAIIIGSLLAVFAYADDLNLVKEVFLQESIITTTGFQEDMKSITNNVEVITAEDIEEHNYKSVTEVLQNSSNIKIDYDVFGLIVDMRGQGNRAKANVQILVDGVNINPLDRNHGVLPLDAINISSIERIEIIPGGGSILYGSGTSGGVINIITKNIINSEFNNSVNFESGSYGRRGLTTSVGTKFNEKLALQFDYSRNKEKGYRKYNKSQSDYFSFINKYQISEKQDLSFKYSRFESKDSYPNMLTKEQLDKDRQGANLKPENNTNSDNKRNEYSLVYNNNISKAIKFTLNTSYQESENNVLSNGAYASKSLFTDKKFVFKPKVNFAYGHGSSLILGYDYLNNNGLRDGKYINPARSMMSNACDMNKKSNSFFALNRYKLGKLELTQGLRYELANYNISRLDYKEKETYNYSKELDGTAIELAANYLYSNSGNIYAKWENSYVLPAPNEMVDNQGRGVFLLNNLKPESFSTFELGLSDYIGNTLIKGATYYTITKDEINVEMVGHRTWKYYNIAETTRYGVEINASHNFGSLTVSEEITYINATITKGKNDGKKVPKVPKTSANIDIKYDFTDSFNTILSMNYKGSYYLDSKNKSGLVNNHFVTDLVSNYTFENGLRVYGGIKNLFDENYYNSISYSEEGSLYNPASERNYFVGFKHNF